MAHSEERSRQRRDIKGGTRRDQMLDLLRIHGGEGLSVEELSRQFRVSPTTVRRDLARLREDGAVARTYGGAALMPTAEIPVRERQTSHRAAKDAIGVLAAGLISRGETIIVDAGTTIVRFAAHLATVEDLTIVTNSIGVINSILENPGPDVIVLGGQLRGINETITGGSAEETLRTLYTSHAVIGTDAIAPGFGIASRTLAQSRIKSQMMRSAAGVIVLADSSKLNGGDFTYWSPLPPSWSLVTDSDASEDALECMRHAGADAIHIAQVDITTSKEE